MDQISKLCNEAIENALRVIDDAKRIKRDHSFGVPLGEMIRDVANLEISARAIIRASHDIQYLRNSIILRGKNETGA